MTRFLVSLQRGRRRRMRNWKITLIVYVAAIIQAWIFGNVFLNVGAPLKKRADYEKALAQFQSIDLVRFWLHGLNQTDPFESQKSISSIKPRFLQKEKDDDPPDLSALTFLDLSAESSSPPVSSAPLSGAPLLSASSLSASSEPLEVLSEEEMQSEESVFEDGLMDDLILGESRAAIEPERVDPFVPLLIEGVNHITHSSIVLDGLNNFGPLSSYLASVTTCYRETMPYPRRAANTPPFTPMLDWKAGDDFAGISLGEGLPDLQLTLSSLASLPQIAWSLLSNTGLKFPSLQPNYGSIINYFLPIALKAAPFLTPLMCCAGSPNGFSLITTKFTKNCSQLYPGRDLAQPPTNWQWRQPHENLLSIEQTVKGNLAQYMSAGQEISRDLNSTGDDGVYEIRDLLNNNRVSIRRIRQTRDGEDDPPRDVVIQIVEDPIEVLKAILAGKPIVEEVIKNKTIVSSTGADGQGGGGSYSAGVGAEGSESLSPVVLPAPVTSTPVTLTPASRRRLLSDHIGLASTMDDMYNIVMSSHPVISDVLRNYEIFRSRINACEGSTLACSWLQEHVNLLHDGFTNAVDAIGAFLNVKGVILFVMINMGFVAAEVFIDLSQYRLAFNREADSQVMSASAHSIANMIIDSPLQLAIPIIFTTSIVMFVGLKDCNITLLYVAMWLFSWTAYSVCYLIGSFIASLDTAIIALCCSISLMLIVTNIFIPDALLPAILRAIKLLSIYRHGYSLIISIIQTGEFDFISAYYLLILGSLARSLSILGLKLSKPNVAKEAT